jgi:hypothetical protein
VVEVEVGNGVHCFEGWRKFDWEMFGLASHRSLEARREPGLVRIRQR